jgi:hypothetical protein
VVRGQLKAHETTEVIAHVDRRFASRSRHLATVARAPADAALLMQTVVVRKLQTLGFKDLRGMTRNPKSLKRNDDVSKGILIAPSKLPRFSSAVKIPME